MGTHRFRIDGKDYEVGVGSRSGNAVDVTVNGRTLRVEIAGSAGSAGGAPPPASRPAAPSPGPTPSVRAPVPVAPAGSGDVIAPISGVVLNVSVNVGATVSQGDLVLVLEAMKMENEIYASASGTVAEVVVKPQQEVRQGDLLLRIE